MLRSEKGPSPEEGHEGNNDAKSERDPNACEPASAASNGEFTDEDIDRLIKGVRERSHPLADMFPMLPATELREMSESIKAHGLHRPVVMFEDKILDGRNREVACKIAGEDCGYEEFDPGKSGMCPAAFVVVENVQRRHLSESQRAMLGAKLEKIFSEEAKANRAEDGDGSEAGTPRASLPTSKAKRPRDLAAKEVRTSPRSVQSAKAVLEKGTPELAEAVQNDEVAVSAAAEVANLPAAQQRAALAGGKKGVAAAAKKAKAAKSKSKAQKTTGAEGDQGIEPAAPRKAMEKDDDGYVLCVSEERWRDDIERAMDDEKTFVAGLKAGIKIVFRQPA